MLLDCDEQMKEWHTQNKQHCAAKTYRLHNESTVL